jgi:hypothetical protein
MSTTAISSTSIFQELQSFYQTRQSDVKQLGGALQSGDLDAAQQAFSALTALGQDGPFASAEPFSSSSRTLEFDAVGKSLAAGNIAGAQAAFAALTGKQQTSAPTAASTVSLTSNQFSTAASSSDDASSIYQQLQAFRQQRQADLSQLGQDLQAGNLSAAQQDFSTLTALGQSGPSRNGQPFQRSDRSQDFQAIGQALQAGDLASAQSAFTSLASTFGQNDQEAQSAISTYTGNPGVNTVTPPASQLPISTISLPSGAGGPVPVRTPVTRPTISTIPPGTLPVSTISLPSGAGGPVPVREPVVRGHRESPPEKVDATTTSQSDALSVNA